MNRVLRMARRLRVVRLFWVKVFGVLICTSALLIIIFWVSRTERIIRPYKVNLYGVCPECGIAIDTTLELFLKGTWHGMGTSRIASNGRVLSGRVCAFECPSCDAHLQAYVDFIGKRTQASPYGEHTRVWDLTRDHY